MVLFRIVIALLFLGGGAFLTGSLQAQRAWEAKQKELTDAEHARRFRELEQARRNAEARAAALEETNATLERRVNDAVTVSRTVPERTCLDLGSVRALDAIRRTTRH